MVTETLLSKMRCSVKPVLLLPSAKSLFTFEESFDEADYSFWQQLLDRLGEGKIGWEELLAKIELPLAEHPISKLMTKKEQRSLLHHAVLADRLSVIRELKADPASKFHPDRFGFTAYELSKLLDRKEAMQLLAPQKKPSPLASLVIDRDLDPSSYEFASCPLFESEELLADVILRTQRAKLEDSISTDKMWMGIYFDKEIQLGLHPPLSIRKANSEVGFGVFSDQKISPCSFIGEYTGVVQVRDPEEVRGSLHMIRYPVWDAGKKLFVIDAKKRGNFTRFLNHSSHPNLALRPIYWRGLPRLIFVSLRELRVGELLTFDHGPLFRPDPAKAS